MQDANQLFLENEVNLCGRMCGIWFGFFQEVRQVAGERLKTEKIHFGQ
jgi:hypothetical protein